MNLAFHRVQNLSRPRLANAAISEGIFLPLVAKKKVWVTKHSRQWPELHLTTYVEAR